MNNKVELHPEFEKKAFPSMEVLYNFALRMTSDKKDAVKLLKETYAKAFWFFPHLDERISVPDWLFRIIRNTFISDYTKKNEEESKIKYEEAEKFYLQIKSSNPDLNKFETEINSKLTEDKLSEILSNLPDDLRLVIVLCDIHKMNYEETADFVDVPLGTVISRLIKARKIIFTELYKIYGKR
ncbi:MAG: sigma-70 family RNA polymerase sigma factor [Ignavibacteriales bacterium]|nr:MAG: sigma-70 family RNA polymerase sigma factor [Ignavibacteriales bacterium]